MDNTLAFIFPGQGSHSIGMLSELAAAHPVIEETFAAASEQLGYDLWALCQHGPESELNRTHKTQPALLAAGVALWRVWQSHTSRLPALMAGHSLGEVTALVCAGVLDYTDAVNLVAARGRYMQETVPENQGAMAAILGLDDSQVREICAAAAQGEVVTAVNFNSPGQVVVAGHAPAVHRAVDIARQAGAKRAVFLVVSAPSHCELMRPASLLMGQYLVNVDFNPGQIAVINNVDVAVRNAPDDIRDALVRQMYSPVRWSESVLKMAREGVTTLIECGSGKVLAGLTKRIDPALQAISIGTPAGLEQALAS